MTQADQEGVPRRTIFRTGAAVGAATAVGAVAQSRPAAAHGAPTERDLILHNGAIHTMNRHHDVVRALAIRDGRVAYTGDSLGAARRAVPDHPRVIDLRGRVAIPGIIDNHNHIVLMGNRPGHHTPLENAYSVADVQRTYRARAQGVPAGEFVTTIGGFHFNQFREVRLPTLAELDAALPDHPAYVSISFSGPSATNTLGRAFFEAAGVVVGADGAIAGGAETGKATLALRRTLTPERRRRGALDAMAYAVSVGVTTHLDQGAFQSTGTPSDGAAHEDNYTMHLPFLELYDQGRATVRLRINFLHMDTDPALPTLAERLRNAFPFFGDDMVRTGGIGEFIAGGLQIAPMNPFIHAYYAVTGRNALGAVINAGQQITRREVLDLYTRDNTWFLGKADEDQLGVLEPDRLGDVVVLDRDYFRVPEDEIRHVRSALTVVGGSVVHVLRAGARSARDNGKVR